MKITKLGHCCLLIEHNGKRILTDPGLFTIEEHSRVEDIDVILITHEHGDHLHTESLVEIMKNNPQAQIITNTGVGKILAELQINFEKVEHGESWEEGIIIEAFGDSHQEIYKEIGQVQNTGYFIDNTLFYPGDAFTDPEKAVEVLALPISGPWMKAKDAIEYALKLQPQKAFPVHDEILSEVGKGVHGRVIPNGLEGSGIEYVALAKNESKEF